MTSKLHFGRNISGGGCKIIARKCDRVGAETLLKSRSGLSSEVDVRPTVALDKTDSARAPLSGVPASAFN